MFFGGKTKLRFIIFGFYLQKIIQLLTKIFWQACQNCNLSVKKKHFEEPFSGEKTKKFGFQDLSEKKIGFPPEEFRQFVKIAISVSRVTIWEKTTTFK